GMAGGPSLMFVALPKVFSAMGAVGSIVAIIFFVAVAFAALTSSVSVMEAIVACVIDRFKMTRTKATLCVFAYTLVAGIIVCLGYNLFYFELTLPNGSVAQILDVMDYISNYVLMPVVAIAECVLIGWAIKPKAAIDEITLNGETFGRAKLYTVMVKYITPVMLFFLLLQSFGLIKA
ncbi:MAG: sodium-dependent transporter, partial [Oscillospiraceae bacterium]|nr:sodium-dependent transporter [Oscillospiraceae bacterium]